MYTPLFDFERDRLIMETPIKFGGERYLFFPEGIDYHTLYRSKRKINTTQEVEYVAEKLLWLNPDIEYDTYLYHMKQVTDRSNGHIVRTYSESKIESICEYVWNNPKKPYCRKRKVIFNPAKMIPVEEKRKIVQKLIHPKIRFEPTEIWMACKEVDGKLTMKKIAEVLGCSAPTLKKSFNNQMIIMLKFKNKQIKAEKDKELVEKAINDIKKEGVRLTVREVKRRVPVRNYRLLRSSVIENL